jgi:hypothetical protein
MAVLTEFSIGLAETGPFGQAVRHHVTKRGANYDADKKEYLHSIADVVLEDRSNARKANLLTTPESVFTLDDYAAMLREYAGDLSVGRCTTIEFDPGMEAAFAEDLAARIENSVAKAA